MVLLVGALVDRPDGIVLDFRLKTDGRTDVAAGFLGLALRDISAIFKGLARFDFISTDPRQIAEEKWADYSVICIDDLNYALSDSGLYTALFEHQRLMNSTMFSPYCCDDKVLDKWKQYKVNLADPNVVSDLFKVTEYMLAAFCYFSFIPFQIPLPNQE